MMYIIFRASSCRKNSFVSYNSLAVKENNVSESICMAMCMCLVDGNDRISLHPTLQNVNTVLKIQERVQILYILSNVNFYNPFIFIDRLNLAIKGS